mmetsp:Transcript_16781/g.43352  ORF Transcript_16781/g.43352 Transcript_16781/m.43352 type:complete len:488 (-) Transcript_16781:43-1506(-)
MPKGHPFQGILHGPNKSLVRVGKLLGKSAGKGPMKGPLLLQAFVGVLHRFRDVVLDVVDLFVDLSGDAVVDGLHECLLGLSLHAAVLVHGQGKILPAPIHPPALVATLVHVQEVHCQVDQGRTQRKSLRMIRQVHDDQLLELQRLQAAQAQHQGHGPIDDHALRLRDCSKRMGVVPSVQVERECDDVHSGKELGKLRKGSVGVAKMMPIPQEVGGTLRLLVVAVELVHGGGQKVGAGDQLGKLRDRTILAEEGLEGPPLGSLGRLKLARVAVQGADAVVEHGDALPDLGDPAVGADGVPLLGALHMLALVRLGVQDLHELVHARGVLRSRGHVAVAAKRVDQPGSSSSLLVASVLVQLLDDVVHARDVLADFRDAPFGADGVGLACSLQLLLLAGVLVELLDDVVDARNVLAEPSQGPIGAEGVVLASPLVRLLIAGSLVQHLDAIVHPWDQLAELRYEAIGGERIHVRRHGSIGDPRVLALAYGYR